jgi:ABC-type uncharacterized transport system fused permease/ATPase subunit
LEDIAGLLTRTLRAAAACAVAFCWQAAGRPLAAVVEAVLELRPPPMAPRWRTPAGLLVLVALLYVRRKKKAKAKAKKIADAIARGEEPPKKKPDPTGVIWSLIKPKKWFAKGKDGEGSSLMLTILVLAGLRTVQISISTRVVQVLDELMNSRDIAGFKQYMVYSVVISLFGTCIRQTWNFTSAHLVVLWRQRLTARLHEEYFKGQAYYFLGDGGGTDGNKVTDPDQRISEDVKKTAEGFAQIFQEVLYAGTAGVYYTIMLYSHYGIVITVAPWLYLVLAQVVVSKVAPVKWAELFGALAAKVASFRDALTRIMLNFEAITALKGQSVENSIVTGRYDLAVAQMKKNHVAVAKHGFTMSFMYQHWLGTIIGGVVILPGVYREKKAMSSLEEIAEVRKTHLLRCHFILKNDHFNKTGSGQAQGKLKRRCVFRRCAASWAIST